MHSVPHRTAVPPQRFTAKEAIAWICLVLPDSFIGAQPAFLSKVPESTHLGVRWWWGKAAGDWVAG